MQQLGVFLARCPKHAVVQVSGQERQVICFSHARDQPVKDNAACQTIQHIGGVRTAFWPDRDGKPSGNSEFRKGCGACGSAGMLRALDDVPQGGAR